MSRERAESVAALLRLQPYLSAVDWGPDPEGTNLDEWRNHYKGHLNLADMVADTFGVPHSPRNEPWLCVRAQAGRQGRRPPQRPLSQS